MSHFGIQDIFSWIVTIVKCNVDSSANIIDRMVYLQSTLMGDQSVCNTVDVIDQCAVVFYQGAAKRNSGDSQSRTIPGEPSQAIKSQADKNTEKVSTAKKQGLCWGQSELPLWL